MGSLRITPFTSLVVPKGKRLVSSIVIAVLCMAAYAGIKIHTQDTGLSNEFKYIFCFACGYMCRYINNDKIINLMMSEKTTIISIILAGAIVCAGKPYSLPTAFIAFVVFFRVVHGCSFFGLLKIKGLRRIGVVSYSVYLIHGIFWFIGFHVMSKSSNLIFISTILFFSIITISSMVSLYIEYPFYDRIKNTRSKDLP